MMIDRKNRQQQKLRGDASLSVLLAFVLLAASLSSAQTLGKAPTLEVAAIPLVTAQRAQATMVNLNFRVPPGYHINSNAPKSEFLIATALKMDLPTDIILGKIEYPGRRQKFSLLARRKAERLQRRLHHRRSGTSAALSRPGKIRNARSSPLSGLRQRRLLPSEKLARKF
jgi:hypothetical protein